MTIRLLAARAGVVAMIALAVYAVITNTGIWNDRFGPVGAIVYVGIVATAFWARLREHLTLLLTILGGSFVLTVVLVMIRAVTTETAIRYAGLDPSSPEASAIRHGRLDLLMGLTPITMIGLTPLVVPIWQGRDPRSTAPGSGEPRA